jgi:tRNA1(Val) A37 N6-methylase TrmN6
VGIFFNEFTRIKAKQNKDSVFTLGPYNVFIYRIIGVNHNDKVLDACCGSGAFLIKAMGNMIKEVSGVTIMKKKSEK